MSAIICKHCKTEIKNNIYYVKEINAEICKKCYNKWVKNKEEQNANQTKKTNK